MAYSLQDKLKGRWKQNCLVVVVCCEYKFIHCDIFGHRFGSVFALSE